ncbi:choice-of-anchor I family protein [Flavobacterium granuli]|uniref:DNA-binding beta-propeller fold protein YncE n=1 Tax=Flavobacterium granuli TaxID=280093 RepID=A0ABU1S462_9FLAO|nr:choice-of-anchor I family protein [Flavobacterium granuli]MDR6845829.1 DNA-binding beta-propeller fold protein YncE [Flavobacterium granuli]
MIQKSLAVLAALFLIVGCDDIIDSGGGSEETVNEDPSTFKEIGTLTIGGTGAAEISAYDEISKKLFTVNNSSANKIDVIDLSDPSKPTLITSIDLAEYNGAANSVATSNGELAVALESKTSKQDLGKVVIFDTSNYALVKEVTVGALPDMITYSHNGRFILTANEGEPNDTYSQDPDGSVSIIDVASNYAVTTLTFGSFSGQLADLKSKGFRIASPTNNFAADIEPEYLTISSDSRTAWVTLQENNGIAKIDLATKKITQIFPLGYKDYNLAENALDINDKDGAVTFNTWKLKGMFQPDAISSFEVNNVQYVVTANEGDAREYSAFVDVRRINHSSVILDPTIFPNAATLKADASMGRLNINTKMGDIDGDGDFDELVGFGARSFSIWNGVTGQLVFDSKNDLDKKAQEFGVYDDGRSDDKSVEPEAVYVTKMGNKQILFVGLERADAFMVYDVSNPIAPKYLQTLKTGDAPEGLLFIPASKSPNKRSLVVVSSEGDGSIKIYQPELN